MGTDSSNSTDVTSGHNDEVIRELEQSLDGILKEIIGSDAAQREQMLDVCFNQLRELSDNVQALQEFIKQDQSVRSLWFHLVKKASVDFDRVIVSGLCEIRDEVINATDSSKQGQIREFFDRLIDRVAHAFGVTMMKDSVGSAKLIPDYSEVHTQLYVARGRLSTSH